MLYICKLLEVNLKNSHHKEKIITMYGVSIIRVTVVIILQYIHLATHYIPHLKLIGHMSITCQILKPNRATKRKIQMYIGTIQRKEVCL